MAENVDKVFQLNPEGESIGNYCKEEQVSPNVRAKLEMIEKLETISNYILEKAWEEQEVAKPLISYANKSLLYDGTITTIQGSKGNFKSRFLEMILSIIISKHNSQRLDFTLDSLKKYYVILIDTERNYKTMLPSALGRIIRNAGYTKADKSIIPLKVYSLIDIERTERLKAIENRIEEARKTFEYYHLIIAIDVVTDLTPDFNSVNDSMLVLDYLNKLANTYNVSILATIHENKKDDNSRGHLGAELINKSTVCLRTKNDKKNGILTVECLHSRNENEFEPIELNFSSETGLFSHCSKEELNDRKIDNSPEKREIILALRKGDCLQNELSDTLAKFLGKSDKTIKNHINELISMQEIESIKSGRTKLLRLKGVIDADNNKKERDSTSIPDQLLKSSKN